MKLCKTAYWISPPVCSVTQWCPTLCNPVDCSPPGSSVHGIFRQEYWRFPCPPSGHLPDPGIKHVSAARFFTDEPSGKPLFRDSWMFSLGIGWRDFYTLPSKSREETNVLFFAEISANINIYSFVYTII